MRDPERPKTKKELLEPWTHTQTRRYDAVCSEQEELEKRLLELEPEKTRILQWFDTSGVDIEENIDELERWLTLPNKDSKIGGEVRQWLQNPSRRPREPMPDLVEFPIELGDLPSVNILVAVQRIKRRKAELEKERKLLEVRLRKIDSPTPSRQGVEAQKSPRRRKSGPRGPRPQSVARRSAIKLLKSEGLKGEIACRKLEELGVPLASKALQEIYGDCGWVSWFKHDRKGSYGQWSADLTRG